MGKRKTSYNTAWEDEYKWLRKTNDSCKAQCVICNKTFRIDASGKSQVESHGQGTFHIQRAKNQATQRTFVRSPQENCILISEASTSALTIEEQVCKAEIIQALHCVDSNLSFASANGAGDRFRSQFPDSKIAEKYNQNETKMKYVIQFGLCPYFQKNLRNDLKGKPFSFKFDETTTSQVKKQYDGYVQYWSDFHKCIVIAYCGTLFVDHCPAEKLVEHFYEFVDKVGLDVNYMLHLGMDGPNVNKKFQTLLLKSEGLGNTTFLDIGTCVLHIVHNAFRKGVRSLEFDVDQFAIDIHFFFKLSAARRADYQKIWEITDIVAEYALKHSSTRWVTLRKVLVRLIEQYENLKQYFLVFLPTTPTFKSTVKGTARYDRITKALKDDSTLRYLSFVVFFATDSEMFLTKFQSMKPRIHILYDEMEKLLWKIMSNFIKTRYLSIQKEGSNNGHATARDLLKIDVNNKAHLKPIKMVDIGTKAKSLFVQSALELGEDEKAFRKDCLKCMQATSKHLQETLPFNSFFLNCSFFQLNKRNDKCALESLNCVAKDVAKALSTVIGKVFPNKTSVDDVCDAFRSEWRLFQTHPIKEDNFFFTVATVSGRKQLSYWEHAFAIAGVEKNSQDLSPKVDVEKVVTHLENRESSGSKMFPISTALMKCVLSMSHGNSAPEGGFSINKRMLDIHGYSLKEDTVEALRVVKDTILRYSSICEIPVTRDMIKCVMASRQNYHADLEAKRLLAEQEARKKKAEEDRRKEEDAAAEASEKNAEELSTLTFSLAQLKNGIAIADESVAEGNKEFKEILLKPNARRVDLQKAQSKIEMGIKRRAELMDEEAALNKRLKELNG